VHGSGDAAALQWWYFCTYLFPTQDVPMNDRIAYTEAASYNCYNSGHNSWYYFSQSTFTRSRKLAFFVRSICAMLCLTFAATVLTSCGERGTSPASGKPPAAPLRVQAYVVAPVQLSTSFTVSGSIRAAEQTELHPEVSGRVVSLPVREGSAVRAGELLVKLYDSDLQAQKKKLQVQRDIAATTERRLRELLAVQGTTQQEVDLAHLQTANAEADLEILNTAIAKTEIRAPYAGVVGLCSLSPGAYVTPQTVITTIRDQGPMRVDFSVPEQYATMLRAGQSVSFSVAGAADVCNASITAFDAGIDAGSRARMVRARVSKSNSAVVPGSFASVVIPRPKGASALAIPTQALIPKAREKNVIVVNNNRARFVAVTTGARTASAVEILSGLQPGDTILTTGLLFVKPNNVVNISSFINFRP
jgi:membrane fusion protein (multidrug efflux system)